jgi:hypothetical protein
MSSSVLGSFRRAREWAYPQLTSSAFLEKGVLTPEEFIIAGKFYKLYTFECYMYRVLYVRWVRSTLSTFTFLFFIF